MKLGAVLDPPSSEERKRPEYQPVFEHHLAPGYQPTTWHSKKKTQHAKAKKSAHPFRM
jgi:hypothetical protein